MSLKKRPEGIKSDRKLHNRLTDAMLGRDFRIFNPTGHGTGRIDLPDTPDCTNCSNQTMTDCAANGIIEGTADCPAWRQRLNARRPGWF